MFKDFVLRTPFLRSAVLIASSITFGCAAETQEASLPNLGSAHPDLIRIVPNNISGGGFQSDVTISPDGLTVYSSADVSGMFKSTDGGLSFTSQNHGLMSSKVASLAITKDNEQIIYAGTGDKGNSGGLFRSLDGGNTWVLTNAGKNVQFAGNHAKQGDPVPKGHPRSNGDLIVVDEGNNPSSHKDDTVIAGSYNSGVRILKSGGDEEATAVLTSGYVRSLARNNTIPNTVFAAIQFADKSKNGIYEINYKNPTKPSSTFLYPTLRPEGLTVLDSGSVYAAIGAEGIVKYDGSNWALQNTGLSTGNTNRLWTAITGYSLNGQDTVYAGASNLGGKSRGSNYSNIWRTQNGGKSWSSLVDAKQNVSDKIYGQQYEWWFRTKAFKEAGLGRTNSVVSSIAVSQGNLLDKASDDILYVSGRGGLWTSKNGGALWEPAVYNMQATANNAVAVNKNNPDQVILANTDYVVLETRSGFISADLSRDKPRGSESRGYDILFDNLSDEVILGTGDRDSNNPGGGEVYIKPSNKLGNKSANWVNTGLSSATKNNNGRVRAVSVGYHNGETSTTKTLLAVVEEEGVYRYHNGTWSKAKGLSIGATKRSQLIWPDNRQSGIVYLLDLSAGLHRSNDGGQSWINMWPSLKFRNNNFYNTGYITADNNNPTTVYVSVQGTQHSAIGSNFKVFRLTQADTTIFNKPNGKNVKDISFHTGQVKIRRPGPLVIGPNGNLWLTQQQDSKNGVSASLYIMQNPAESNTFIDLTTKQYQRTVISPSGIDVSSEGIVYVSQNGIGLAKIALPCNFHDDCQ